MNGSKRSKFGARIALARAAQRREAVECDGRRALGQHRTGAVHEVPCAAESPRRSACRPAPIRIVSPARPYAFVRLAVVMMRGERVAATGRGRPGTASR